MRGQEVQDVVISAYPNPINTLEEAVKCSQIVGNSLAVNMESAEFASGFVEAQTTNLCPDVVTEKGVVEFVQGLIEVAQEGWMSDEFLRTHCGVLAGWLLRPTI
jgi:hypothetical protein